MKLVQNWYFYKGNTETGEEKKITRPILFLFFLIFPFFGFIIAILFLVLAFISSTLFAIIGSAIFLMSVIIAYFFLSLEKKDYFCNKTK